MVTIREVAEKSGVSTATVSRILVGGPARERCNPETVQRVESVARHLGYQTNYHMRAVRRQRSDAMGFVVERYRQTSASNTGNWYFEEMCEGIQAAAQDANQMVVQVRSDPGVQGNKSALRRGLTFLQERRLDSLVIPGILGYFQGRLDDPVYHDYPVVVVEPVGPTCWCSVGFDAVAGVRQVLEHLAGLGHRHLLWIGPGPRPDASPMAKREEIMLRLAFSMDLCGQLCLYDEPFDISTDDLMVRAEAALLHYLDSEPRPFTAIVAFNDLVAIGACHALARRGVAVPAQVSVVGFDDSYASIAWPPLTTVSHRLFDMGLRAGQLAMEMTNADPARRQELRQQQHVITPHLVQRESTGPASATRGAIGPG